MSDIYIYDNRLVITGKDSPDYHITEVKPEMPKDVEPKRGKKRRRSTNKSINRALQKKRAKVGIPLKIS